MHEGVKLPYLRDPVTLLRNADDPTFTNKVLCQFRGPLSHYSDALKCSQGRFGYHKAGYRRSSSGLHLLNL